MKMSPLVSNVATGGFARSLFAFGLAMLLTLAGAVGAHAANNRYPAASLQQSKDASYRLVDAARDLRESWRAMRGDVHRHERKPLTGEINRYLKISKQLHRRVAANQSYRKVNASLGELQWRGSNLRRMSADIDGGWRFKRSLWRVENAFLRTEKHLGLRYAGHDSHSGRSDNRYQDGGDHRYASHDGRYRKEYDWGDRHHYDPRRDGEHHDDGKRYQDRPNYQDPGHGGHRDNGRHGETGINLAAANRVEDLSERVKNEFRAHLRRHPEIKHQSWTRELKGLLSQFDQYANHLQNAARTGYGQQPRHALKSQSHRISRLMDSCPVGPGTRQYWYELMAYLDAV